jgi:Pectinacetylesterase
MRLAVLVALVACSTNHNSGPPADGANVFADAGADGGSGPIAPANQWTWIEVPGTTCGNGSVAGFGVNPSGSGSDLFVYFEGGGACWDAATCFTENAAINITTTYGPAQLGSDVAELAVDRSSDGSVLAPLNYVFVPYCTGDIHAGSNVMDYGSAGTVHHTGATNTAAFVAKLQQAFPSAANIYVLGSSAGGYGATMNFHRFTGAWPSASVHLLQDSSPFVPFVTNYSTLQAAWQIQFPPGCTGCGSDFTSAFDAVATAHPNSRIGLLTFDDDATVSAYFGYTSSLVPATMELVDDHYTQPLTKAFVVAGTSHTMLGGLSTITAANGELAGTWVTQWLTGDPSWTTVKPAGD